MRFRIVGFGLWILTAALLGGCIGDYPEDWREKAPRGFSAVIPQNWQNVHRALADGALHLRLGAEYGIHQELHPDVGMGSIYAFLPSEGRVSLFLIDVKQIDSENARVTVHTVSRWWEGKIQDWLDETLAREFPAVPEAPKR